MLSLSRTFFALCRAGAATLCLAGCASQFLDQAEPEPAPEPPIETASAPPVELVKPAPPPPDLVVIGAIPFAPAPDDFDRTNPILPTLAERLSEGFERPAVKGAGDAWAMAVLCRMPEAVDRLVARGGDEFRQPDLVLLTRSPTDGERALCAEQGVRLNSVEIGRYLGGLPDDTGVEGAWVAYSAARLADYPEKRALIDKARLLIGADAYSRHFSAL